MIKKLLSFGLLFFFVLCTAFSIAPKASASPPTNFGRDSIKGCEFEFQKKGNTQLVVAVTKTCSQYTVKQGFNLNFNQTNSGYEFKSGGTLNYKITFAQKDLDTSGDTVSAISTGGVNFSAEELPITIQKRSVAVAFFKANPNLTPNNTDNNNDGLTGTNGSTDDNLTCEAAGATNPLSWVICPIFNGMADLSQTLFRDIVVPYLKTPAVTTDTNEPIFKIWSNFRIYGNILLVVSLLVIVFGQAIGGGLIDAYTAKKVLPRIAVAAILINLSIYIVAFLVDITNIVGGGIGQLMLSPLKDVGLSFSLSGAQSFTFFSAGILGLFLGAGSIFGFMIGLFGGGGGKVLLWLLLAAIVPALLAILGVFFTLIIRRGLIMLLIILSPIAFALYCLPNTERFFKQWWDWLFKALMVYPIVVALFAIATIMSYTVLNANNLNSTGSAVNSGTANGLAVLVAFVLQFLPLLLIPFAFKFAGGLVGGLYGALTNGVTRINGLAKNRKEQAKRDADIQMIQGRQDKYQALQRRAARSKGFSKFLYRQAAGRVGGYNIEAVTAAMRAQRMKELQEQISSGRDEEIRGLTVNKTWAEKQWRDEVDPTTGQTRRVNDYVRINDDGSRSYQTLGGAWIQESDVDSAYGRWGHDTFAQQAALAYEERKANTNTQRENLRKNYTNVAMEPGGWGNTGQQAYGSWIGAAFENQNSNLQYKYEKWQDMDNMQGQYFDYKGFTEEVNEKRGVYPLSQMDASTIRRLSESWDYANDTNNNLTNDQRIDMKRRLTETASTISARIRGGDRLGGQVIPEEGGEQMIPSGATGAAGNVQAAFNEFTEKVFPGQNAGVGNGG